MFQLKHKRQDEPIGRCRRLPWKLLINGGSSAIASKKIPLECPSGQGADGRRLSWETVAIW